MPRTRRPQDAHLTFHITSHATGPRRSFPDDGSRAMFKGTIAGQLKHFAVEIHAYAMMDNHVHLMLTTREEQAGILFLRNVLGTHAKQMNLLAGYRGPLWQTRYHSVQVETEDHALHACLYIDANPWRAFAVEHPEESTWTSHRELAHGGDAAFVTPHPVLLALGDEDTWRPRYRAIMAEYLQRGSRTCCPGRRISKVDPLAGLRLFSWNP